MAVTFDGPNLTITLESGVTSLDWIDVYSDWKRWVNDGGGDPYPPAFRTVGGDPLSAVINAGAYFFLRNDLGWRIKPPEEDITILVTGNLALEDVNLPSILPTTGNFTAAVLGLQPVTQGVVPVMGAQLAYASFSGSHGPGVWVDVVNGTAGTGTTADGAPIGNAENPSNNIPDAVAICIARGLPETVYIIGNLTLDTGDVVTNFRLVGQNAARTTITINTGATISNSEIVDATVTGTLDGNALIRDSFINGLTYFSGFIFQCELAGTITLGGAAQADILSCYSGVAGAATPTIDFGGSGQSLALRAYSGGVKLTNKTGADPASIDLSSGQVIIDLTTVTNGSIVVRGDGKVVDNADTTDHLLGGTYGGLTLANETTSGLMVQEIWTRLGLDPDNPLTNKNDGGISATGIDIVATPSGDDIIQTRQ